VGGLQLALHLAQPEMAAEFRDTRSPLITVAKISHARTGASAVRSGTASGGEEGAEQQRQPRPRHPAPTIS
jgi:hypothetical protein